MLDIVYKHPRDGNVIEIRQAIAFDVTSRLACTRTNEPS